MTMHSDFHILDSFDRSTSLIPLITFETTLVLAIAAIVAIASKKASAAARAIVWCGAIAATIAIPVVAIFAPGFGIPLLENRDQANRSGAVSQLMSTPKPIAIPELQFVGIPSSHPEINVSRLPQSFEAARTTPLDQSRAPTIDSNQTPKNPGVLAAIVFTIWSIGFTISILSNLVAYIRLKSFEKRSERIESGSIRDLMDKILTRLNIHKRVRWIKGDAEVMPMTWGTIRPIVLLPSGFDDWSAERSRVVLTHEAAHIRRLDHFTQMLARFAVAIHWFNPFVGFAAKALRIESERACDDLTLTLGETPSTYADVLLQTARSYRVSAYSLGTAGIAVARKSRLEARVSAILDPIRNRQGISRRSLIAIVAMFLLISILLGSIRPTARTAFAAPPKTEARSKVNEIVKRPSGPMSFAGRVIDLETKKPIEGVKIVVNRYIPGIDPKDAPAWVGDETLRSDADGRFTLTFTAEQIAERGLAIKMMIDHPDYVKRESLETAMINLLRNKEYGYKQFFEDMTLEKGIEFHGEIVSPDGKPAPRVPISFLNWGGRNNVSESLNNLDVTTTDEFGRFRLRMSDTPLLVLRAHPNDYADLTREWGTRGPANDRKDYPPADLGRSVLKKGARIRGEVLDLKGDPIPGVSLSINDMMNYVDRRCKSNDNGRFLSDPLAPGFYLIDISGSILHLDSKRIRPNYRVILPRQVEIKEGIEFVDVSLKEIPTVQIEAKFIDSKGRPAFGDEITIVGSIIDKSIKKVITHNRFAEYEGTEKVDEQTWGVRVIPDPDGTARLLVPKGLKRASIDARVYDEMISLKTKTLPDGPPRFWGAARLGDVEADRKNIEFICYHATLIRLHLKMEGGESIPERVRVNCGFMFKDGSFGDRFQRISEGEYHSVSLMPDHEYEISAEAPGYFESKIPHVNLPEGASAEYTIRLKKKPEPAKIGDAAPPFTVKTLDGRTIDLKDFKGKCVLLDFFTVAHRSVLSEGLVLKEISKKFGGDPRFAMFGFSMDRDFDSARKTASENKLDWPRTVLIDGTSDPIAAAYGANEFESIYLVDPQGKLIANDLHGKAIEAAVSKALGEVKK
jgi:beta-lactamase regulating signal transducer with metallopeptidase domain/peroxiredoxin